VGTIDKRINELHRETEALVNERQALINKVQQVETRLTQIVGAITELNKLKGDAYEDGTSGEPVVPQSDHETEQPGHAD
jgi:chaperonin cofactor prefoldin